jgi:hypothetical protein
MLGHSDIATTAKFYSNVLIEDVRDMEKAAPKTAARRRKLGPGFGGSPGSSGLAWERCSG